MPDPDAYFAGGSTGALARATQLANLRVANAKRAADLLRRRTAPKPKPAPARPLSRQIASGGEGRVLPAPKPMNLQPGTNKPKLFDVYGRPIDPYGNRIQGPGFNEKVSVGGIPGILGSYTNPDPENLTPDTTTPVLVDEKGQPQTILPGTAGPGYVGIADWQLREGSEIDRFVNMTPEQQLEARKNVKATQEGGRVSKTIQQMLDDIKKDPLYDADRFMAGQDLANAFKADSQAKYFTDQDLTENPFLATLNDLSVWSTYRLKVAEWNKNKNKTGDSAPGLVGGTDAGDGTYTGLIDNGSFSSVTSPSNLSPYLVTREENGLLQVVTADQWIQGKFARMRNDPEYAAEMITALAMTSAYGSDSSANNQRSRVSVDAEGNPIKAFVSVEDLNALKQLANEVVILQNQGDEVAIDDSIAELVAMAAEVNDINAANGEYGGGGGGGGYGYGGGGYGGGGYGGGGGGSGAVRYTDATQLTSLVSSIARQRMGRELTPEEAQQFVQYFHGLEEQNTAAYYAGQSNTQLDPEGQAVDWITSHFAQDSAAHQYGNLAAAFMQMMGSSQFLPGVS